MEKKQRQEIVWLKKDEHLVASMIIWNDNYQPYQAIVFRKEDLSVKAFIMINGVVYKEDFLANFYQKEDEDDLLFSITSYLHNAVNYHSLVEEGLESEDNVKFDDDLDKGYKSILDKLFYDSLEMREFMRKTPDFGFYSLSHLEDDLADLLK